MFLLVYLKQTDDAYYTPKGFVDSESSSGRIVPGQWRNSIETNSIQNIRPVRGSKYTKTAVLTREKLTEHLVAGGSVSWQWDYIRRTGNEEDFLTMPFFLILLSTLCQN